MSLEHKNVVRNNDEYFCTACGKSWDATDRDPPVCDPVARTAAPYNGGYLAPFVPDAPTTEQQVAALRYERPRDAGKTTELERRKEETYRVRVMGLPTTPDTWPTPEWDAMEAHLVFDVEYPEKAMLVYARSANDAVTYVKMVTGCFGTLSHSRCRAMDGMSRGVTTYIEANPANRKRASKSGRVEVLSLLEWRHGA